MQAARGQLELSNRARPISEVLKDERISPRIKKLLAEISEIKKYGESFGIQPTHNYTDYVQLDRKAATYVVSASDRLAFRPRSWNFPVVGSFTYVGWFHLEDARRFADELKTEDLDVDLRGARAFSTLGWFRDAILSTMIPDGDEADVALGELVNVVIHESVHATLYLKNQSYFNESLAQFVADELTPKYLSEKRGPESVELKAYQKHEADSDHATELFHEAYLKLDALYRSSQSAEVKLSRKSEIYADLKKQLNISREINNATLIQFKTYGGGQAEFKRVLKSCDGSVKKFLASLSHLSSESFPHPQTDEIGETILKVECRR